jgi:putative methyltransferase (TIGR04325 family)
MGLRNVFSGKEKEKGLGKRYASFEEALKECKTSSGYEDSELCKVVALKTLKYKAAIQDRPYDINCTQSYLTLAIQYILLKKENKNLSVIDFGGACGAHYYETRRLLGDDIKLHWNIVETREMIKQARENGLESKEISFLGDISSGNGELIYLSSSIQYVPKPYEVIDSIISSNSPYILFNRMMLNEGTDEDIITVQQSRLSGNGPGKMPEGFTDRTIYYPHTTMSYRKFMNKFRGKYELVLKFDEQSGKVSNEKGITGNGFLFIKK